MTKCLRDAIAGSPGGILRNHGTRSCSRITPENRQAAEGHLRRVIEMFEEGRSCLDLAQQLHAVKKAVGEAKKTLIHDHVDHCLDTAANGTGKSTVAVVDEFKAISKYL